MKSLLKSLILLFVLVMALSSCTIQGGNGGNGDNNSDDDDSKVCEHTELSAWQTVKAATCTEKGLTDGIKCSKCGEILVEQEIIDELEHTEVTVDGIEPTCTEKGKPLCVNGDAFFNVSHCGDIVICAVDKQNVGIDIEFASLNSNRTTTTRCVGFAKFHLDASARF